MLNRLGRGLGAVERIPDAVIETGFIAGTFV